MARRATSLGPKPSLFIISLFGGFCLLNTKNLFFPAFLCIFESLLLFLLSLFWPPHFSISLLLLSLVLFFFSSFLSFFSAFFWFLVFLYFFSFLSSLLLFHQRNFIKTFNCIVVSHLYFLICWFHVLFLLSNPFFISLRFPDLSCVSCSTLMFWFQKTQVEKHQFLVKRGVATKLFFYELVFCKM